MSELDLKAIETRREAWLSDDGGIMDGYLAGDAIIKQDIPALIAEVRRLRKLVEATT